MSETATKEVRQVAVKGSEARRQAFDAALNSFEVWSRKLDRATEGTSRYEEAEEGLHKARTHLYECAGV